MSTTRANTIHRLSAFFHQYWGQVWRYMVAGLLVWIPLIVTVWVAWLVVNKLVFGVEKLIRQGVFSLKAFGQRWEVFSFLQHLDYYYGLGFLIVVALFLSTGFLTRYYVGRKIIGYGEEILQRIPLIRRVYRAVQQIRDTFIGRNGAVFQHVCLVEYPKEGMLAVAFVTSTEYGIVQHALGREMMAIFVPTTPNPTSGYLVYVPPDEVVLLDITVEDAMKLIISGGAYVPDSKDEPETLPKAKPKDAYSV